MSSKTSGRKSHAVCVPCPAQGHVNPMMKVAQLLHFRGFFITIVNTEFYHRSLVQSKGPEYIEGFPGFQFKTIPDGLPPSDHNATQDVPAVCASIRKNCLGPFRSLLTELNSSEESPPVTCVVADGIMGFGRKAAQELGIPEVQFWTASACGLMGYLQYPELIKRGIIPFKDESFKSDGSLDTTIDWIPGMRNIRLKDIPSFIRTTDPEDFMLTYAQEEAQGCLKSSAIIFNTFDAFEHEVLEALSSKVHHIYTTGPLSLLARKVISDKAELLNSSLWKEDRECLKWLDQREPKSVVYVNYGSVTVMTDQHLKEFAWGLANSKRPFLWIIRPDVVMGDSAMLPQGFLEETRERGMLASWCPQEQVLSHPSIGVFLTHCGWNSTLESICGGVPMICWPFFSEQQTNCRYVCTEWGIGVEVNEDVKHGEIEELVKEMMEGDKCIQMRRKALQWKKKAEEATAVGGSSHKNFDRFIKEALHHIE